MTEPTRSPDGSAAHPGVPQTGVPQTGAPQTGAPHEAQVVADGGYDETAEALRAVQSAPFIRTRSLLAIGLFALASFGALLYVGLWPRLHPEPRVGSAGDAASQGGPSAAPTASEGSREGGQTLAPRRAEARRTLSLPADLQAEAETTLYARATGYLRKRLVDIGDDVKRGQLLAVIEAPELDAEVAQAQASIVQAEANIAQSRVRRELAELQLKRAQTLAKNGYAAQQELDERRTTRDAEAAGIRALGETVRVQQANLRRLKELQGFTRIRAPFSGRITARSLDVGTLITAGGGQALFKVSELEPMRAFLRVPQLYAPSVRKAAKVTLSVRGLQQRTFAGQVSRTAGSMELATRTLLVEARFPNADGALLPGMYAQATLTVERRDRPWLVPSTAVVTTSAGQRVAVRRGGKVTFVPVVVGDEERAEIEVRGALREQDAIYVNPDPLWVEGMEVKPAAAAVAPAAPTGKTAAAAR